MQHYVMCTYSCKLYQLITLYDSTQYSITLQYYMTVVSYNTLLRIWLCEEVTTVLK